MCSHCVTCVTMTPGWKSFAVNPLTVWNPWISPSAEFPPLACCTRPFLQFPSVTACLVIVSHSLQWHLSYAFGPTPGGAVRTIYDRWWWCIRSWTVTLLFPSYPSGASSFVFHPSKESDSRAVQVLILVWLSWVLPAVWMTCRSPQRCLTSLKEFGNHPLTLSSVVFQVLWCWTCHLSPSF